MGPVDPPYQAGLPINSDLRMEADKRASAHTHRLRHPNERRRELPSTSTSFPSHSSFSFTNHRTCTCPPLSLSPLPGIVPTSPTLRPPQVPPTRRIPRRPARSWRPSRARTTRTRPTSCRRRAAPISSSSSSTAKRSPHGPRPTRGARRRSAPSPAPWSSAPGARIGMPTARPLLPFAMRRGWSPLG